MSSDSLLEAALAYAARGIAVLPLAVGDKIPLISKEAGGHGALDATTDVAQIRAWWTATPRANIGVAAGASGLLLVDIDNKDGRDGFTAWEVLRAERRFDDTTPHVWTPNNGKHCYFAAPPGIHLRNTDDELGPGIETKANGKYCVAPPSRLHDGRVYRWDDRLNLNTVAIAPLPHALCSLLKPRERADRPASRPAQPLAVTGDLATVQDALRHIDPWAGGYQWWVSLLMALHSEYPGPDGLAVAEAWADGKDGEVEAKWQSFEAGGGVTIGTLYFEAEKWGWLPPWRTRGNGTAPTSTPVPDEPLDRPDAEPSEPGWMQDGAPMPNPATTNRSKPATPAPTTEAATWADMAALIGPIAWEWPDWLPSSLLVELVADSGAGKSTLALRIAATFLLGWMWPDGTPYAGVTGKVLWCESEAGQAINLERAQAWGLPIKNILSPFPNPLDDVSLFDPAHLAAIAANATREDVRLIVVDSLSGGTAGREKAEDQMPVVKWLAELARNLGKPVILLHHLRKRGLSDGSGNDSVTLDRVRGSTVIVQPARVVWALDAPNPNMPNHKRLSVIKSNLGRFPKAIGVHIDDDGLSFDAAPTAPKAMSKLDQAKLLLLRFLAGGPRLQTDIEAEAISEGISMDTMRDAKKKLRCRVEKDGHTGKWSWSLPDTIGGQDREHDGDGA